MSAEVEFFLWLGIYLFGIIITYIGVYVFDDSASREDNKTRGKTLSNT